MIAASLILWTLRHLLLLLFAAIVLALALCSLVETVQRRFPMQRSLALLGSVSGLGLVLAVLLVVLVPPFVDEFALLLENCLLYTSPSPRDRTRSRMPSSA